MPIEFNLWENVLGFKKTICYVIFILWVFEPGIVLLMMIAWFTWIKIRSFDQNDLCTPNVFQLVWMNVPIYWITILFGEARHPLIPALVCEVVILGLLFNSKRLIFIYQTDDTVLHDQKTIFPIPLSC